MLTAGRQEDGASTDGFPHRKSLLEKLPSSREIVPKVCSRQPRYSHGQLYFQNTTPLDAFLILTIVEKGCKTEKAETDVSLAVFSSARHQRDSQEGLALWLHIIYHVLLPVSEGPEGQQ